MKTWLDELVHEKVELQIAPLIDCVFLLLIYFMVTSTLRRKEADLNMSLPGVVPLSESIQMPDEQIIEILADGTIMLNTKFYTAADKSDLPQLEYILRRYQESSALSKTKALITIMADDESQHERVVDVLNVCAGAGITNIVFGNAE